MMMVRLCVAFVAATAVVWVLPSCAAVHDATPSSCPANQQPSGGLCVCTTTLALPTDGGCPSTTSCQLADCVDDDNPCTEATCVPGADACTHEPVANLSPCEEEAVTGTCLSGQCVVQPVQWQLGVPFRIGGDIREIAHPKVAIAANGEAVAIWSQGDALMACHFDATEGWEKPLLIEEELFSDRGLAIDMDAAGNAIVVYTRVEDASIDVRAIRFSVITRLWGAPEVISRPGSVVNNPSVRITSDGHVVAAWLEAPGEIVLTRTRTSVSAWDPPLVISPNDGFQKEDPVLSVADNGEGAVIYGGYGLSGVPDTVWVTPIGSDGSVGMPTEVDASAGTVSSVQISAAESGELMALWERDDDIWHAYFSEAQWNPADLLEASVDAVSGPTVTADADANFHAVWAQGAEIRARRFSADEQAWEDIQIFRAHTDAGGMQPSLTAHSDGEAWLVWYEHPFVWTSYFAVDSGWGAGTPLSPELEPDAPASHQAQLASSEDGTRVAVWADGTDVWSWAVRP